MAVVTATAKRDYSIDGIGPISRLAELRQIRSAAAQALRDVIGESWRVVDGGTNINVTIEIRVLVSDVGMRRVKATAHLREVWVEKGAE